MSLDSPTSETRNRRRLAMAAAAVVAVVGTGAVSINSMNSDDEVKPAPATASTVAPTTVAPRPGSDGVTYIVPDGWEDTGHGVTKGDPGIGMSVSRPSPWYTIYCSRVQSRRVADTGRCRSAPRSARPLMTSSRPGPTCPVSTPPRRGTSRSTGLTESRSSSRSPTTTAGDCNGMFGFCSGMASDTVRERVAGQRLP